MFFKLPKPQQYLRIASYVCRPSVVQVRTLWKLPFSKDKDEQTIKNAAASKVQDKPEEESTSSFTDKLFKAVKSKGKNEFVKSTHGPGSSVKEFDYLLSMIPDKILGGKMKESLRDLIKIAEGVYRRVGKEPVHPLVLNMALLRMYAIQSHEENQFLNRAVNDGDRSILTDEFTSEVMHYFKCASEVYLSDPTIRKQDILLNQLEDEESLHLPRHIVFLDHITKSIVISIRGTASISDMITDLYIEASPFLHPSRGILAHKGISDSATALLPTITTAIKDIQHKNNGKYMNYRVVTTGHSLGAGTAALLAILLSTQSNIPVTSYAFAPPPVISHTTLPKQGFFTELFNKPSKYTIHSFVHDRDFIPRCSHRELLNMLSALTAIDSLSWTDLERSTAIFHNTLNKNEMLQIKNILNSNRQHIIDGNDTELYVPGQVYLLRPIPATIMENSKILSKPKYTQDYYHTNGYNNSTSNSGNSKASPANRTEKGSDTEKEEEDLGLSSSWLQLVKKTVSERGKGVLSSTTTTTSTAASNEEDSSSGNIEDNHRINTASNSSGSNSSGSDSEEERKQDERLQYELIAVPSADSLFNGLLYYGDSMVHDHLLSAYRKALIKLVK